MEKQKAKTLTKRQYATIIENLRGNSRGMTTLDFRFNFGIIDPPARIVELKKKGYQFHTSYQRELDHHGKPHEGVLEPYPPKIA